MTLYDILLASIKEGVRMGKLAGLTRSQVGAVLQGVIQPHYKALHGYNMESPYDRLKAEIEKEIRSGEISV